VLKKAVSQKSAALQGRNRTAQGKRVGERRPGEPGHKQTKPCRGATKLPRQPNARIDGAHFLFPGHCAYRTLRPILQTFFPYFPVSPKKIGRFSPATSHVRVQAHSKINPTMKTQFRFNALLALVALLGALFSINRAAAQTTNAFDQASDPAYNGDGAPNGLSPGGQNGGTGFGAWTFTVLNSGGAFINGSGPSGKSFDLWNTSANSSTIAVRPLSSPLAVGQSFSVQLRLNSLDNSGTTNALILEDASGNPLFMYWHTGFEPNNAVNGHYTDAATVNGAAVNFQYAYQQFQTFTFTLNSATTYTFIDNSTGGTVTGTISGSVAKIAFFRGSLGSTGGGQDFQFDELEVVSATPPIFAAQTPSAGAYSVPTTNAISVQVVAGSNPINNGSVAMQVDGHAVTPAVNTVSGVTTVSYLPSSPLSAGAPHTVLVTLADNTGSSFTNGWSFNTAFGSLPVLLAGPITASNNVDVVVFTTNDVWLGTNYQSTSSLTLYARFGMEFNTTNDTSTTYTFGGFEFWQNSTEQLLVGKSGASQNWSMAAVAGFPDTDIPPVTPVVTNQWHIFVVRVDFSPGGNATAQIWLDPDFTQTEAAQPNAPLVLTLNDTFNNIHLRSGFSDASATYSNIIISATSAGVGFVAPSAPQFQGYVPGLNAPSAPVATPVSATVLFGTYGIGVNSATLSLDGNTVTPTFTVTTNSITANYLPPAPFVAGSTHTAMLSVTDSNGTPYSTSWSFAVDSYPTLPIILPGPYDETGGGLGETIFSNLNEWVGGNYQSTSSNTLYTQFSMVFYDLNGETMDDQGGCFGGLHFYQGTTEKLLTGETWLRNAWSCDDKMGGESGETNLLPITTVVVGDWHTMVVKNQFQPGSNTLVTVWLDPDFTKSEGNQLYPPLVVSMDDTFDTVRLRCGNGSAYAEFSNIVMTAVSPFAAAAPPGLLSMQNSSGSLTLSWTSIGTVQGAPAVTGPWTDLPSQANPQTVSATSAAQFFRLRQ
jgi:hypothetical protein